MRIPSFLSLLAFRRGAWPLAVLTVVCLNSCSSGGSQTATLPLPVGHYEGSISYQGTDRRVALDLREASPGKLEADLHFPEEAGSSFAAANVRYKEPQLQFEQQGSGSNMSVTAIREGDFLRGVFTLDSLKAEFVWARRGQAAPRAYQAQAFAVRAAGRTERLTVFVPADTAVRHSAVVLLAAGPAAAPALARADMLARQGILTVLVPFAQPPADADSAALQRVAAILQALRKEPSVDSMQVGLWLRGAGAGALVAAAGLAQPAATFVLLENVPATTAAATKPFQQLSRQRIPVLAYYAAADTSLNARESARRLRSAVGARRGSLVRVFPQATADFIVPGRLTAEGKWTWPQPAPEFTEGVAGWLRQRRAR
ncbi:hypothetical protein [Hymenobacter elongatus]|uniref:Dienelactone hydrolase domain-containing protein n=1 Tax=Hymenobacter elongatus TaxID=877208 RepID=A0A4Z0PRK6_9BACT|nr:hypothetical protein [Hymenobacter elongatus]TGE19946.1 hypothetical protein E5J99_02280 [Hymenobacter elongatus]